MNPYGYRHDFYDKYIAEVFNHEQTNRELRIAKAGILDRDAEIAGLRKRTSEQEAVIAALQESLDEATARINSGKPGTFINYPVSKLGKTTDSPIQVGHRVRSKATGREYTVIRMDGTDVKLGGWSGWWGLHLFTKVS